MKKQQSFQLKLEKIVGGGQALGQIEDGRKAFVWGGLPGEEVTMTVTKKKSRYIEGIVTDVQTPSPERIEPRDPTSYVSTSPWQIMTTDAEQRYKAALIEEAFELHDIVLPDAIDVYSDGNSYEYRNKIEFSWWWDTEKNQLDLAFFMRGTHGKIPVDGTSLAHPAINKAAQSIRDVLRTRGTEGRDLKTVIIRSTQTGRTAMQLYVKTEDFAPLTTTELASLTTEGFELIYSNPKSPASVITKRVQQWGTIVLTDTIFDVPFTYAAEGFFQINLPVYQRALQDMKTWVDTSKPTLDLYSGVGTIGLTIGGDNVTLVESNEHAVREMEQNIVTLGRASSATPILTESEKALDYITGDKCIIVDPPRAGLHADVTARLLDQQPERIIYLSCNPVTQARDVALLAESYGIRAHRGYNFFPRTPHIEHLVILDRKK